MDTYTIAVMREMVNHNLAHIFVDGIAWIKLYNWVDEGPIAVYWFNRKEGGFSLLRIGYFIEDKRVGKENQLTMDLLDSELEDSFFESKSVFCDNASLEKLSELEDAFLNSQNGFKIKRKILEDELFGEAPFGTGVLAMYGQDITE